jgi:biotin carboxylase
MKQPPKNIIAYVMNFPAGTAEAIRQYEKEHDRKYRIMLIVDAKAKTGKTLEEHEGVDIILPIDFSRPHKIAAALMPYQTELLAITCRGDNYIGKFRAVIPHVPYLRTPTSESLAWATDKYEMRRRFRLYDPKSTPVFTRVKENSKKERARIIEKIGFPMVVKPTNLGASLFVTVCYHEEELDQTLRMIFRKIRKAYEGDKRIEEPKVIAEEFMEGDMYSIDSYVDSRGTVYHCPLVRVITGKNIGRDDFFNYRQSTPTALKRESIERAHAAAEVAIHSLGLRSTSTHTELMKIDDDWKIIEIGPRLGGFRDTLHSLSCDINHTMNDILIRIPKKPIVPKKCKGFAAVMKWFAPKEGRIVEMKGIKKIESLDSFHKITVNKKIGDRAVFAKNGGRSIFNLYLYNQDRSKLLADIRRVEQLVQIKVHSRTK